MSKIAIVEKREVWQKVGEKEVKVYEYDTSFYMPDIAVLWNKDKVSIDEKKLLDWITEILKAEKEKMKKELK